ncbi:MAG: cobyrinate a,c-diamide synthase [Bacteroidales bacterium]|nr:cobyrinate a,c-diamide synthase [Bacteroidales bacterium]
MKPQLLIGALHSGSGKTTFTMGILRALQRQGLQVQPFKCGPDYIDTRFHALAAGRESVNLDTWLASERHVRDLYARYGADADACVAEGVMGLFDGYDRMAGSSAAIARLLDIPVVLVVGARSMAYTVAAQLHGMKTFLPGLRLAGVVFNQVSSENHFRFLAQACEDAGLRCFGWLPKVPDLEIPSRHLGLTLAAGQEMERWIDGAADLVTRCLDLPALLEAVCVAAAEAPAEASAASGTLRIAVARDAAFNFTYRENLSRLSQLGQVRYFSPLAGDPLPEADLVYLPGGYPELFAAELSSRRETMQQLRDYAESGGRILAECGGMIYLSKAIEGVEGGPYPLCGVLPFSATMAGARLHLGYRRLVDAAGREWRGHEFHYSAVTAPDALPSVAQQYDARGGAVATPLYRYKNVIAGYTHLYWGETGILNLWD